MRSSVASYGLILLVVVGATSYAAERVTVELQAGEGVVCGELNTPRPWTVPPHNSAYMYPGIHEGSFGWWGADFEIRISKELLITVFSGPGLDQGRPTTRLYSPDKYAVVQKGGRLSLASATDEEWQGAKVLAHSRKNPSVAKTPRLEEPLEFLGHAFVPSGRHWWSPVTGTYLPADSSAIALLSWSGTVHIPEPYGSPRYNGRYFIDLYHLPNVRRLALIQGRFQNVSPDFATLGFWIEGPTYILPTTKDMRRIVLCEVR